MPGAQWGSVVFSWVMGGWGVGGQDGLEEMMHLSARERASPWSWSSFCRPAFNHSKLTIFRSPALRQQVHKAGVVWGHKASVPWGWRVMNSINVKQNHYQEKEGASRNRHCPILITRDAGVFLSYKRWASSPTEAAIPQNRWGAGSLLYLLKIPSIYRLNCFLFT